MKRLLKLMRKQFVKNGFTSSVIKIVNKYMHPTVVIKSLYVLNVLIKLTMNLNLTDKEITIICVSYELLSKLVFSQLNQAAA